MSEERWTELKAIRGTLGKREVLAAQVAYAEEERAALRLDEIGPAEKGTNPHEVVIGISPAFGIELHATTAGHRLSNVLRALVSGVKEGGGSVRVVRCLHTADTSFLGL